MEMAFCRGCGKEIHVSAPTCPNCGAPQVSVGSSGRLSNDARTLLLVESRKKSGWIAAILNWFIPGAGYMYCGRVILGVFVFLLAIGVAVATMGFGLLFLIPILVVDGFLAANRYNKKMMAEVLAQAS